MLRGVKAVFKRELKEMFSRPIYLFGTLITMAFCSLFFLSLFSDGIPTKIPVGLVDNDNTSISRRFYRELNATPGVDVKYFSNYTQAREAMQVGEIYGFLEIPKNMYSDMLANRRPKIGVYSTQAYMITGSLAYRTFLTMGNLASGAIQREVLRAKGMSERDIMGMIQPIVLDNHLIGNPWTNYGVYLINAILPGILQLCVLLMTIFPIGYELKRRTSREWLETGGGSMFTAIIGKLLPYTIIFIVLGLGINILLYKVMSYPLQGSILMMFSAIILLVIAAQAFGVFMIGLFPVLRDGVSFAALYGILSISLAGMTFPLEYMPSPVWGVGQLFPLRHYFLIYVKEGMLAGGFANVWLEYVCLLAFLIFPFTIITRLKKAVYFQNYPIK